MGVQWMFLGQVEANREKMQRKDHGSLNRGVEKFREDNVAKKKKDE